MSACRAKHYIPNSKFIVLFRNPVDRAYSEYTYVRNRCRYINVDDCPWPNIPFYNTTNKGLKSLEASPCSFNHGLMFNN